MRRRIALIALLAAFASLGAEYRTANFVVYNADPQVCQSIGQWAEHYRREKAQLWLGREMPRWPQPCPLYVQVSMQGPSGATSFQFGPGGVNSMKMEINGPLERLIHSVLPHEVTHTVFAYHFRRPVPRWADEGGSVLSEDDIERRRHDSIVRQILNRGQQIPLRRLFALTEYPPQVMCLYAQGFSMSEFLVGRSDRKTFLAFVGHGMHYGWDSAVRTYYRHNSVEELEQAWLQYLRDGRRPQNRQPGVTIASNQGARQPGATATNRTRVHLTVPPVQPLAPPPVARAAMPTADQVGQRFGQPAPRASSGVQLLAPVPWTPAPAEQPRPHFVTPTSYPARQPAQVQLGGPVVGQSRELPPGASPVGFPR